MNGYRPFSLGAGNGSKCPEGDLHEGSRNRLGRVVNRHSPTDKWTARERRNGDSVALCWSTLQMT